MAQITLPPQKKKPKWVENVNYLVDSVGFISTHKSVEITLIVLPRTSVPLASSLFWCQRCLFLNWTWFCNSYEVIDLAQVGGSRYLKQS